MVETENGPVDDETGETEVNFRMPRGSDPGPDQMPRDIPVVTGTVGTEADTLDPGQTRRLWPPNGAKPKLPRYDLPIQRTPGPRRPLPGAGTQPVKPVTDRFAFEMPTPIYGPERATSTHTGPVRRRS